MPHRETDWRPANIPDGLGPHVAPCTKCRHARAAVVALVNALNAPPAHGVRLFSEDSYVVPHLLNLRCPECANTGWIIDRELRDLLYKARAILEPRDREEDIRITGPHPDDRPVDVVPDEVDF